MTINDMPKRRLIAGQQDLFGELPPVAYCRVCRRRLEGAESIERGIGRHCQRIETGAVEVRRYCGQCGRRVRDCYTGCPSCGNGFETRTFRTRSKVFKRRKVK